VRAAARRDVGGAHGRRQRCWRRCARAACWGVLRALCLLWVCWWFGGGAALRAAQRRAAAGW
jgi:hypothetical protein